METYTLLSLSALIGLALHFTTYGITSLVTRRQGNVVHGTATEKETAAEKDVSDYDRRTKIFIPNTLARWPWLRRINPHYAEVKRDSDAWIARFNVLSPRAQRAFDRSNFSLLACMAYPIAKKEHIRVCCDTMNLLFLIDELTDVADSSEVRKEKEIIMDAFHNPRNPRPKGEWIGGEAARQFWELAIQSASKQSQRRFIKTFDEYLEAVVEEAKDRNQNRILDVEGYIIARRDTSATKPAFALLELGLDIPDEIMSHPAIQEVALAAVDLVSLDNDIVSYNLEQSRGYHGYNILTAVTNELGTDVNGAILWAQDWHTQLEEQFHAGMAALPQLEEPLNSQVREYCNGLGQWVRANVDWSFEGERYLGDKGLEVKEKRWMSLLPKRKGGVREIGPVSVDGSLL